MNKEELKQKLAKLEKAKKEKKQKFRANILQLIMTKQREHAINNIVKELKQTKKIHTIRSDINSEIWIYQNGILVPEGKTYIKEFIREILQEYYTSTFANSVISKIEVDTYINEEDFFKKPSTKEIAVKNGILNLKTKKLTTFTPEKIFFTKINANYKPNQDCKKIKKFLKETLKNEEDIKIIQELFGFILYPEYFIQKAFMFLGEGSNGKSIIQQIIKKLLTSKNCSNIPLQKFEQDEFILSELHNKLVCLGGEINNTSLKETDKFKSLTSKDMITANRKFLRPINFINYAKLIFNANQLPKTYDTEFAFFRRWIILDFPYTFLPEAEYNLRKDEKNIKLANINILEEITTDEEMSGLLNFALEGLDRLLQTKIFSYSKTTEEVQNIWIRKSDSFSAFMNDCVIEEWGYKITKSDLRKSYANYCKIHKVKGSGDKLIKAHLNNLGVTEDKLVNAKSEYINCWDGIRFNSNNVKAITDVKGFSGYIQNLNFPKSNKTLDIIDTLDTSRLESSEFELKNVIINFFATKKEGCLIDEIIELFKLNNLNHTFINNILQNLLSDGVIVEIKKDLYKLV